MRKLLFTFLAIILTVGLAFSTPASKKKVLVKCELTGCTSGEMHIFRFNGVGFTKLMTEKIKEDGSCTFKMPAGEPAILHIGTKQNNLKPILLGSEPEVTIKGECGNIRKAETNSKLNKDYDQLKVDMRALKNEMGMLVRKFQRAKEEDQKLSAAKKMKSVDERKFDLLESTMKKQPYLGKVVAINTYLSYPNNGEGYINEPDYYAQTYFQWVDWSDEAYHYMPWVYEAFKDYSMTLASIRFSNEKLQEYLEGALEKVGADSPAQQLAIGGILGALRGKNDQVRLVFAERFIERFKSASPEAVKQLEEEISRGKSLLVGGTPPDFTMNTPEGESMSLSDLRGKVVLLDFWASWCGPCRRENPNVVNAYQKYKEKGFDVFSVSLDSNKDRWQAAIEKDGMVWHHVSDLKKWQNEAAQLYGVRSIPHTILLDREGRILAKNLRGAQLEAKLKEVFGE